MPTIAEIQGKSCKETTEEVIDELIKELLLE